MMRLNITVYMQNDKFYMQDNSYEWSCLQEKVYIYTEEVTSKKTIGVRYGIEADGEGLVVGTPRLERHYPNRKDILGHFSQSLSDTLLDVLGFSEWQREKKSGDTTRELIDVCGAIVLEEVNYGVIVI